MLNCKGWIPVEERKPTIGLLVLLLIELDCGKIIFDIGGVYARDGRWFILSGLDKTKFGYQIKFWKPLPDIPDCYEEAEYGL